MNWTSETAAELARYDCRFCGGGGLSGGEPCACVCRRVFHSCYRRFRICSEADAFARLVTFRENRRGVERHLMWFRRNEDYCADFQASARRALAPELYRIFRFYHVLGGSADLVARNLGLSRTVLYNAVEEIEERVGREFALMEPHSLYPPRIYLGLPTRGPCARAV